MIKREGFERNVPKCSKRKSKQSILICLPQTLKWCNFLLVMSLKGTVEYFGAEIPCCETLKLWAHINYFKLINIFPWRGKLLHPYKQNKKDFCNIHWASPHMN